MYVCNIELTQTVNSLQLNISLGLLCCLIIAIGKLYFVRNEAKRKGLKEILNVYPTNIF